MAIEHNAQTGEIKTVGTGETATATPAIDVLRFNRNRLLRATDHYALSDVTTVSYTHLTLPTKA